jgi:hypothetical protein
VRRRPVTLGGTAIAEQAEGSPMYVMARENGEWLLVACRNTPVIDS